MVLIQQASGEKKAVMQGGMRAQENGRIIEAKTFTSSE
jgi:hypothetical protein